jgi:hypothetical protein
MPLPCNEKIPYQNKADAMRASERYFRQHGWKSRAYICPHTKRRHWHLTTMSFPEFLKPLSDAELRKVVESQARLIRLQEFDEAFREAFALALERRVEERILELIGVRPTWFDAKG